MKAVLVCAGAVPVRIATVLAFLAMPAAQAATMPYDPMAQSDAVDVRFDPGSRETRVAGRIAPALCFSLSLPEEWRLRGDGSRTSLQAVAVKAGLNMEFRSARELQDLPHPDLASRDAAFLQRDYEELLGRPAQSVSLTSPAPGATRWSATWIDANLPAPSQAMTVDALIVPLSDEWVLELSLEDVETQRIHDALIPRILSGLKVRSGAGCRG